MAANDSPGRCSDQDASPAPDSPGVNHAPLSVNEVLESISDAFFALDREGRFTYLNGAAERLLLRKREELLGQIVWIAFPESAGSVFHRECDRASTTGVTVQFEEYYPPLAKWFSVRAYPTPSGLAVYFQDVTERKFRDEELRRANERFQFAARAVEGLIYDVDLKDGTTERSAGLFGVLGFHPDETEGTSDWWMQRIHPEDLSGTLIEMSHVLADPAQTQYEVEYRVRHRDGHHVFVWDRGLILRGPDGQPVRLVGNVFDITARRRTEEALRESEERHRVISELTSDYNYAVRIGADGSASLELVTDGFTRITGYTLEEVNALGGWAAFIHPDDLAAAFRLVAQSLMGEVNSSVLRIVTKQGAIRWVSNLNKPAWNASRSRVVRVIGAAQDITERRQAEEALRESREQLRALSRQLLDTQEKERRRLAHELHDELGQTLTAISINLQTVKAAGAEAARPRVEEALAIVDQAIEKVRHLSLDLRPSMLDDLGLEAALRWYAYRQIRRTGLAIHLDIELGDGRLPPEMETACFRVVQEALTNVIRHAHARRVWIEVHERGAEVELSVRDDGTGFDLRAVRRRSVEGVSFGLLGMRERVELLGGDFNIESRPGQGTSIFARFVNGGHAPTE